SRGSRSRGVCVLVIEDFPYPVTECEVISQLNLERHFKFSVISVPALNLSWPFIVNRMGILSCF
ncbi:hypothetical protein J6590_035547, partial [Homalodisca vitripennis]